jgi:hypothetical protein
VTRRTSTHLGCLAAIASLLLASYAHAAEVVVIGSPDDDAQVAAQAIIASIRSSVVEHPWLGLSEIDVALGSGPDPREPVRQANRALRAARAAFDELLIDEAAKYASTALTGFRSHLAQVSDMRQVTRTLELLGAIALTKDDSKTATAVISEMAALDPDAQPSAELYNPPMLKKWQAIVASYHAQKKQTLVVETPSGGPAIVEIDGRFRGLTPFVAKDVVPGVHYVRVSRAGSVPYGGTVNVGKKAARVAPTLAAADNAKIFESAREDVWKASPDDKRLALNKLAALLPVEYLVLVTTTQRDGAGAAALTPVNAELYSTSKQRILRTSDAAFGVRPGSAPPLSRTFVDGLLPVAPRLALAGSQAGANDNAAVASVKHVMVVALKAMEGGADVHEIPAVEAGCLTDAACMARTRGDSDGVMVAKVSPSGKDVSVTLATYVGTSAVGQVLIDRARGSDALLLAIADQVSHAFLEIEELRFHGQIVGLIPSLERTSTDNPMGTAIKQPPSNPKRTVGIITASAGLGLAVAGFTLAGVEAGVLSDANSTGAHKDSARSLGRTGIIVGGVGVAAVVVGTVLWLTSGGRTAEASEPPQEQN